MTLLPGRSPLGAYRRSPLGVRGVAPSSVRFVAVSNSTASVNNVMTSSDGLDWKTQTLPGAYKLYGVVWGDGQFVAVGDSCVLTSPDGVNWTAQTPSDAYVWEDVIWGNNLYVATASNGVSSSQIMTSPNGVDWTTRTSVGSLIGNKAIAHGAGKYIAVAGSTGNPSGYQAQASSDGFAWSGLAFTGFNIWKDINFCNEVFVIVGEGYRQVEYSTDGLTWYSGNALGGSSISWNAVTHGESLWASVSDDSAYRVMTSSDLINWTQRSAPNYNWNDVIYDAGLFVAVGLNKIMSSSDAINWTARTSPAYKSWKSLAAIPA